jgi:hypothetical protein
MKFPRQKDCVEQGAAMWCQLACYLTIVRSSNTQDVLGKIGFANGFNLTHLNNVVFMEKVFHTIGRPLNPSAGFSLNEFNIINRKFGFNAPMPTTYENIANMQSRRAYFDLFNRKNGYIMLKFHTGQARHFCVLTQVKADELLVYNPQGPYNEPLTFDSNNNTYHWDPLNLGPGWPLVAYQEL